MKRQMDDKTKGIIAILVAFVVIFSPMTGPLATVIALGILSGITIWKISNK